MLLLLRLLLLPPPPPPTPAEVELLVVIVQPANFCGECADAHEVARHDDSIGCGRPRLSAEAPANDRDLPARQGVPEFFTAVVTAKRIFGVDDELVAREEPL